MPPTYAKGDYPGQPPVRQEKRVVEVWLLTIGLPYYHVIDLSSGTSNICLSVMVAPGSAREAVTAFVLEHPVLLVTTQLQVCESSDEGLGDLSRTTCPYTANLYPKFFVLQHVKVSTYRWNELLSLVASWNDRGNMFI